MSTKKNTKKRSHPITNARKRLADLREKRPHKSFQLTKRRDVPKRPSLPGYFKFTAIVFRTILNYKKYFTVLLVLYVVVALLVIGLAQQDQYRMLVDSVDEFGGALLGSDVDPVSRAIGVIGVTLTGGLNMSLTESQQLMFGLLVLATWLVLVWSLRQLLAGNAIKVRDGLYNGLSPFVSTLQILALMFVQALPAAIGVMIFSVATQSTGLDGVVSMMFGIAAILLGLLSFYWLASSIYALLIVSLPGTYPMAAIRAAGELAVGRRLVLMLRLVWLGLLLVLVWAVVFGPVLLLDNWLNVQAFPLIPLTVQILSGFSLILVTTYLYLLYREMINESTK